jgi:hypothetical protein
LASLAARAARAVFDCSLPLAAIFAGLPPSSSDLAERKNVVPPSPPAHSSPLGLVLAALPQFVWRSAARTSRIRLLRHSSPLGLVVASLPRIFGSLAACQAPAGARPSCLPSRPRPRLMNTSANELRARAAGWPGSASTMGTPASPEARSSGSSGICASRDTG